MDIEFDETKDRGNLALHGVPLALARELDWDRALVWLDQRYHYDEYRMLALVPKDMRLYYVAFVDRSTKRRIISLRKATRKEVRSYVEAY